MKKIITFIIFLASIFMLSGCIGIIENAIDYGYQNIEADHFELVSDEKIELLVGTEELPDFKDYIDRVTKEGTKTSKDRFDVNIEALDIDTVGEYEIVYEFFSFDTPYEYTVIVYVVEEYSDIE